MESKRPVVRVVNIITRSQIRSPFDLSPLTEARPFNSSDPRLAHIPVQLGNTRFSIFRPGSVISRASKSIEEFEDNLLQLFDYLETYNLELELEYTTSNIVAVSKLELSHLDLYALSKHIPSSSYDSCVEDAGCNVIVYPLQQKKPRKTILIFSSSSITLTGFRSLPDLKNQAYELQKLLGKIVEENPEVKKEK